MKAILAFDGGARPKNPGHAGFASLVWIDDDSEPTVCSRYLGRYYSNNVAEYHGLIVGIKLARELKATELHIKTDSKLVMNHVIGEWLCKKEDLQPLCKEARKLLKKYFDGSWTIKWAKRTENADADDYCTKAIWWGMNLNPLIPAKTKLKRPGEIHDPFST
jgi:ribonuclease HI